MTSGTLHRIKSSLSDLSALSSCSFPKISTKWVPTIFMNGVKWGSEKKTTWPKIKDPTYRGYFTPFTTGFWGPILGSIQHFIDSFCWVSHCYGRKSRFSSPVVVCNQGSKDIDQNETFKTTSSTSPAEVSSVQNPGWLFDIGDEILPSYIGIIT